MPSNCEIDERSDVWSLGCTLYAMAYGKFVLDSNGGRVSFIYYDIRLVIRLLQFLMVDLESILVFFFKSSAGQVCQMTNRYLPVHIPCDALTCRDPWIQYGSCN